MKQQIGWKIPINRIDPEINLNTSHGRRSRQTVRSEELSATGQNHLIPQGAKAKESSRRSRTQVRRVSSVGSITDVKDFDTMSIESIQSVEAAIGKAVSLTDSDSEYETPHHNRLRRKSKN